VGYGAVATIYPTPSPVSPALPLAHPSRINQIDRSIDLFIADKATDTYITITIKIAYRKTGKTSAHLTIVKRCAPTNECMVNGYI